MAVIPAPAAMPSWQVTGTTETIQPSPTGSGVDQGVLTSYTTSDGHSGSVFVPFSQLTPDAVKQAITARVALLSQVRRLSSGG